MTTERPDRGARALAERLPRPTFPSRPTVLMFGTREQVAAAILANGAAFLPDGFPNGWHAFRDVDPEAGCPTCGFPAWSHDPGTAFLYDRPILPDGAELERLVDEVIFDLPIGDDVTYSRGYSAGVAAARESLREALRAALEPEGSAQG